MVKKDNPGVYIPPPVIYVLFFFLSFLLQRILPVDSSSLKTCPAMIAGWTLIGLNFILTVPAIWKFIRSKNTLVTVKPANSLQTKGIYAATRNPMYLGLLFLYSGIAVFKGNWWTFILIPFLVFAIRFFVIRKEEDYLDRAFGSEYGLYKQKVRRWI